MKTHKIKSFSAETKPKKCYPPIFGTEKVTSKNEVSYKYKLVYVSSNYGSPLAEDSRSEPWSSDFTSKLDEKWTT